MREFSKFWFFWSIIHRLWWKNAIFIVLHHKRCIIDPKKYFFENSRTKFLVPPKAMLHTKNGLSKYYTAPEKWCGSFFTLKFAQAFFAKISTFRLIFGQYFQKFYIYGQFWYFLLISPIKFTYLAWKTHLKCIFLENIGVFSSFWTLFYIKE